MRRRLLNQTGGKQSAQIRADILPGRARCGEGEAQRRGCKRNDSGSVDGILPGLKDEYARKFIFSTAAIDKYAKMRIIQYVYPQNVQEEFYGNVCLPLSCVRISIFCTGLLDVLFRGADHQLSAHEAQQQ